MRNGYFTLRQTHLHPSSSNMSAGPDWHCLSQVISIKRWNFAAQQLRILEPLPKNIISKNRLRHKQEHTNGSKKIQHTDDTRQVYMLQVGITYSIHNTCPWSDLSSYFKRSQNMAKIPLRSWASTPSTSV